MSPRDRDLGGVLAEVQKTVKSMEDEKPHALKSKSTAGRLMYEAYSELIFGLLAAIMLIYC